MESTRILKFTEILMNYGVIESWKFMLQMKLLKNRNSLKKEIINIQKCRKLLILTKVWKLQKYKNFLKSIKTKIIID